MLGDRVKSFLANSFLANASLGASAQPNVQKAVKTAVKRAAQKVPVGAASHEAYQTVDSAILASLSESVVQLPPPLPVQLAFSQALGQAIQTWKANPEIANNSLVVLGSPIEDITRILKASLQTWERAEATQAASSVTVQSLLGGYQRPPDPLEIKQHIQRAVAKPAAADPDNESISIVVVPRLEQCFLRCIQGWEGVEYLQNLTTRDPSRFWVFGCNHWAWAFLDRVCQVSAYLEQPLSLPDLSGEDLKAWLSPMVSEASVPESGYRLQLDIGSDSYWNSLSNAAGGIGATAASLWLNSLRVKPDHLPDNPTGDPTGNPTGDPINNSVDNSVNDPANDRANGPLDNLANDPVNEPTDVPMGKQADGEADEIVSLVASRPTTPSLMGLEVMDRYVLHTLLIHGEMTRSHLALSLGEAERKVRSRLQVLRREGIILQRGRRLSVHPAHYPKLFNELKNNNFLIGSR